MTCLNCIFSEEGEVALDWISFLLLGILDLYCAENLDCKDNSIFLGHVVLCMYAYMYVCY
jgi:hypothetical protein